MHISVEKPARLNDFFFLGPWFARRRRVFLALAYLSPAIFFLVVFGVWPVLYSFDLSLFRWNGLSNVRSFVGLQNWARLLVDPLFWLAFRNNAILVIASLVVQIPLGVLLGFVLVEGGARLRFFKTVYFFPMLMSSVAIGILFKQIFDPNFGFINGILETTGLGFLAQNWLGDPKVVLISIISAICWQFIPFYMILFIGAFSEIPLELHDAARIDGANSWDYLWRIALPCVLGTVRIAAFICIVGSLKYFEMTWVMTQGGPVGASELMATYLYKKAFPSNDFGYGSTIAAALFVIVMIIGVATFLSTRRYETEV